MARVDAKKLMGLTLKRAGEPSNAFDTQVPMLGKVAETPDTDGYQGGTGTSPDPKKAKPSKKAGKASGNKSQKLLARSIRGTE